MVGVFCEVVKVVSVSIAGYFCGCFLCCVDWFDYFVIYCIACGAFMYPGSVR
jgi:hypothetical protein